MPNQSAQTSRRNFLATAAFAGAAYWVAGTSAADSRSPNEKLNVAVIGCGGKGAQDLADVSSENIVALCDVDQQQAKEAFEKYPRAKKFNDYRRMLDQMGGKIDAVTVSTPDHTHAPASLMAMRLGKHVFCQKPLSHSISEARLMRQAAAENKVATQMGNQGTAKNSFRAAVEILRSGAIGQIRDVHIWTDRPSWPQGIDRPSAAPPVPATLDWDLWLGTAPKRPYHPMYVPQGWRGWWDFGTGALGDMACHQMNLAFFALELGAPNSVEAASSGVNRETAPKWSTIRYEFPQRGDRPAVDLTWYDGGKLPPSELLAGHKLSTMGELLIGDKGIMYNQDLLPAANFADYKPPGPTLLRSPGHHAEWIRACKGGPAAMSNFDYAAQLTETILLGNVALRVGKKILWDAAGMKCLDCPEADQYVRTAYRAGWGL